jgi:hypothetical protein
MNLERRVTSLEPNPAPDPGQPYAEVLASVLERNFHNEPNLVYLIPNEQERRHASRLFFLSAISAGQLYGEIHTTERANSVAVWIRPEHDLSFHRLLRTELMTWPFNGGWEHTTRYMKLCASIEASRQRLAPRPHWYLMFLGMDMSTGPDVIRKSLIEPVLSCAESAEVFCYLETFSESTLVFYKECGFRIAGAGRIPDGGPNFWAMTRPARTIRS